MLAYTNVEECVSRRIQQHIQAGHFIKDKDGRIVGRDGQPTIICWSFDATRVHKGMKQTSCGFKFCNSLH